MLARRDYRLVTLLGRAMPRIAQGPRAYAERITVEHVVGELGEGFGWVGKVYRHLLRLDHSSQDVSLSERLPLLCHNFDQDGRCDATQLCPKTRSYRDARCN